MEILIKSPNPQSPFFIEQSNNRFLIKSNQKLLRPVKFKLVRATAACLEPAASIPGLIWPWLIFWMAFDYWGFA